jgi:predicted dithiol-disulfide oxidoreductase (DUF899 family)
VVPQDYVVQARGPGGRPAGVRLPGLSAPGRDWLVIYRMMVPRDPDGDWPGPARGQTALLPLTEGPCPSCTAFVGQLDGAAGHARRRVNLAVAAKAPAGRLLAFAAGRGWRRLRLLSSAGTGYNRGYLAQTPDGRQQPLLTVSIATARRSATCGARNCSARQPIPGKNRAMPAPSSRCGTCAISSRRAAEPTGMSS